MEMFSEDYLRMYYFRITYALKKPDLVDTQGILPCNSSTNAPVL